MRHLLAGLIALTLPSLAGAVPQPPAPTELPYALRRMPEGTAWMLHLRVGDAWDHPRAEAIRTALGDRFRFLAEEITRANSMPPERIESVTFFLARQDEADGRPRAAHGTILTTRGPLDRQAVLKNRPVESPDGPIPDVLRGPEWSKDVYRFPAPNVFTAIDADLDAEYQAAKPYPADDRVPEAIRAALDRSNLAVLWIDPRRFAPIVAEGLEDARVGEFAPLFAARSALITFRVAGEELRVEGRLIGADGREEPLGRAVSALIREFASSAKTERDRIIGGINPRSRAVDVFLFDRLIEGLNGATTEGRAGVVTARTSVALDDRNVGRLREAIGDMMLARLPRDRATNLKRIGLAMHNYHDVYNGLPAAAITDNNGKPLLSWRVAALAYFDDDELTKLFARFKLDQPWDSEHNNKLLGEMPAVYALPGVNKPGDTTTHYRVFTTGPKGVQAGHTPAFHPTERRGLVQIPDGTSNTLMAVEAAEAVPWTKPEELEYDPNKPVPKLYFDEQGRCAALRCDGSSFVLRKGVPEETLRALITADGGEVIHLEE